MSDITDLNLTRSLGLRDRLEASVLVMLGVGLWETAWVKLGLPTGLPDPVEFGVWLTSWVALWAHGHLLVDIRRNALSLIAFMYVGDIVRLLVPVLLVEHLSPFIRGVGP
jgi:hypothetical protein